MEEYVEELKNKPVRICVANTNYKVISEISKATLKWEVTKDKNPDK